MCLCVGLCCLCVCELVHVCVFKSCLGSTLICFVFCFVMWMCFLLCFIGGWLADVVGCGFVVYV